MAPPPVAGVGFERVQEAAVCSNRAANESKQSAAGPERADTNEFWAYRTSSLSGGKSDKENPQACGAGDPC